MEARRVARPRRAPDAGRRRRAARALVAGWLAVVGACVALGASCAPAAKAKKETTTDEELARLLRPDPAVFAPGPGGETGPPRGVTAPPGAVTAPPAGPVEDLPVQIAGVAQNAKLGAVVVDTDGASWYVEGLDHWESGLVGARVKVNGWLRERKLAPDPVVDSKGAVSAGMHGTSHVIIRPTWQRVP